MPERAISGNAAKNQWERSDVGRRVEKPVGLLVVSVLSVESVCDMFWLISVVCTFSVRFSLGLGD